MAEGVLRLAQRAMMKGGNEKGKVRTWGHTTRPKSGEELDLEIYIRFPQYLLTNIPKNKRNLYWKKDDIETINTHYIIV